MNSNSKTFLFLLLKKLCYISIKMHHILSGTGGGGVEEGRGQRERKWMINREMGQRQTDTQSQREGTEGATDRESTRVCLGSVSSARKCICQTVRVRLERLRP